MACLRLRMGRVSVDFRFLGTERIANISITCGDFFAYTFSFS